LLIADSRSTSQRQYSRLFVSTPTALVWQITASAALGDDALELVHANGLEQPSPSSNVYGVCQ
jgi:hypothetical protein